MNRQKLLGALKVCRPALASNDLIPVLSHFCFDGGVVFAYNDITCISAELADCDLECAVPGEILYKVLDSFSSKEVTLELGKKELVVRDKGKRSKVTLPFITRHSYLYSGPDDSDIREEYDVNEHFIEPLDYCLGSVPDNPLLPYQMGITLTNTGSMYASDGNTISYGDMPFEISESVLLPTMFCKQLISYFSEGTILGLGKGFALARFENGTEVFTKLPFDAQPERFQRVIEKHIPSGDEIPYVEIPKTLEPCLERCMAILGGDLEKIIQINITEKGFEVYAESRYGTISDSFKARIDEAYEGQYDVEVLRKAIQTSDSIAFLEDIAIVASDEGTGRLIAQKSTTEEDD